MIDRLEETLKKYNEITEELTKEETLKNISLLTKLSKEQSDLSEIVEVYKNYKNILNNIEEDKELLKDNELKDIAKEELETLENEKKEIEKKLEYLLLGSNSFISTFPFFILSSKMADKSIITSIAISKCGS